jgi:hypothetical protein
MQKPTHLFKLALALPISFLLADAVVAYPCDSVGGEAYNHHGSRFRSAATPTASGFSGRLPPMLSATASLELPLKR